MHLSVWGSIYVCETLCLCIHMCTQAKVGEVNTVDTVKAQHTSVKLITSNHNSDPNGVQGG